MATIRSSIGRRAQGDNGAMSGLNYNLDAKFGWTNETIGALDGAV